MNRDSSGYPQYRYNRPRRRVGRTVAIIGVLAVAVAAPAVVLADYVLSHDGQNAQGITRADIPTGFLHPPTESTPYSTLLLPTPTTTETVAPTTTTVQPTPTTTKTTTPTTSVTTSAKASAFDAPRIQCDAVKIGEIPTGPPESNSDVQSQLNVTVRFSLSGDDASSHNSAVALKNTSGATVAQDVDVDPHTQQVFDVPNASERYRVTVIESGTITSCGEIAVKAIS